MPYLDGHDRLLLKELRPERVEYAAPVNWVLVNSIAFIITCVVLALYWS
jgi:hypothetical protein